MCLNAERENGNGHPHMDLCVPIPQRDVFFSKGAWGDAT